MTRMSTPWGTSQTVRTIMPGVVSVTTASHGGIGISLTSEAGSNLTPAARAVALNERGYYWYEEDCLWSVAAWDLGPSVWPILFASYQTETDDAGEMSVSVYDGRNQDGTERYKRMAAREYLRASLSRWEPGYLVALGESLDLDAYSQWQDDRRHEQMRRDKHPDLIVSAMSMGDGRVKVATADERYHIVTKESYDSRRRLNLLSSCVVLESGATGFY